MEKLEFLAAGCTPARHVACYCCDGPAGPAVVYAAGRNVVRADLLDASDRTVLLSTADTIACIKCDGPVLAVGAGSILYLSCQNSVRQIPLASPIGAIDIRGGLVVACTIDSNVVVCDAPSAELVCQYSLADRGRITSVCLLPVMGGCAALVALTNSTVVVLCYDAQSWSVQQLAGVTLEGHTNWVSCMSIAGVTGNGNVTSHGAYEGNMWLATGSHDNSIRLWRISLFDQGEVPESTGLDKLSALSNRGSIGNKVIQFDLETVLMGHEDLVHSVAIVPLSSHLPSVGIVSAGGDGMLFEWRCVDPQRRLWQSVRQLVLSGAASNAGGPIGADLFDACLLDLADTQLVVAHNALGSFVCWRLVACGDDSDDDDDGTRVPALLPLALSGHIGGVNDVDYDAITDTLCSASDDKTIRLWSAAKACSEYGRPLVHGHDVRGAAIVSCGNGPARLAVVSDEKIVRILADQNGLLSPAVLGGDPCKIRRVRAPPLGLSNHTIDDKQGTVDFDAQNVSEETIGETLWPEEQKLYGHEDELQTIAKIRLPERTLLATSARSSLAGDSLIRLWTCSDGEHDRPPPVASAPAPAPALVSWSLHAKLPQLHSLTVVQLAFSPSGRYLLSCSRDRSIGVYDVHGQRALMHVRGVHQRIVWAACWLSDASFCAASRDGLVAGYALPHSQPAFVYRHRESVTAVAYDGQSAVLAFGCESGRLYCATYDGQLGWKEESVRPIDPSVCPCGRVTRLLFVRPLGLCVASEDHSLRTIQLDAVG